MKETLKKIIHIFKTQKTAISYTSGSLINSFAQILSSIIILAYVGPDDIGIWNSLILFQTYSLFLQSGIINGLNRELPFYLGKGDRKFAESIASTALFYFLGSIAVCFVLSLVLFFIKASNSLQFHLTFAGIVIITLTKFYEDYLTSTFRSNHAFEKLAKVYVYRGLFLLASIVLVIIWGYYGYIIRMVLISILFTISLHVIRPIRVKPAFVKSDFILLLKVGLPIFTLGYVFTVSGTIDRAILIKSAGFTVVGYYSLALMSYNALKAFPVSLANYIYPKMSYDFGQKNDKKRLTHKALKINLIVLIIMMPVAILGYFALPWLIPILFPKYVVGISAAQILLFASVFSGASIGVNVIWSMKMWKYIIISQVSGALLNIILIYSGYKVFRDPIIGVSTGVLCSQILYMIITNYLIILVNKNDRVTG